MDPLIGLSVGHYRILEPLGSGGMGIVYKGEDVGLNRPVAIKFLPPEFTRDAHSKERFIHEAQAASALDHNNICTIHEIGETAEGRIFIAMAYYDGETLARKIDRHALAIDDAMAIAIQIAQGLSRVHERGIVHRDIKPANVMITSDGDAKILDFGLARLSGRTVITRSGSAVGTVEYMSPEQARGGDVDRRSDLFSLGAVLYEMTTGRRPFTGDHEAAVTYSVMNADPPPPRSIDPSIPPRLEAIILKALEKDPGARYQSASDLRSDLLALRGPSGTSGSATSPWGRRHRVRKRYLYAGAAVAAVIAAWFFIPRSRPPVAPGPPYRICVLPFRLITERPGVSDWPRVVQMIMVDHLNGAEHLRVIDPFSLGSLTDVSHTTVSAVLGSARQIGASFIVNGTIENLDSTYVLRCTLTDVADGSVRMSDDESTRAERDLPQAVQNISEQVLNYFQIQSLSEGGGVKEDLKPWLNHRTKKLDAIKAFLQGAQFKLRWQPGGEKYFRRAIELDSTFVTPRTWLISGLVLAGELPEAKLHQAFLMRHLFESGPFEQALIRWTGAMIDGNMTAQEKALQEALEYSPHNDVLLYLLADIEYSKEDYPAAEKAIRLAVESGWNFQPASLLLGSTLLQMREYPESRDVLERSLSLETVVPETYAILAALALRDGDSAASREYAGQFLRRARSEGGVQDSVCALLAGNFALLGLHGPACEYYAKAIEFNPARPAYSLALARSALDEGDLRRARAAAARALELEPGSLRGHEIMGRVAESQGDTAEALKHFGAYLAVDSTSSLALEIRDRVKPLMK